MNKKFAEKILDELISVDLTLNTGFYEMGRLLHSIREDELWDVLEYESFTHLVEEELSVSPGTAANYANTYAAFKRLKYNKTEAIQLIIDNSFTNVKHVISGIPSKLGKLAFRNRVKEWRAQNHQINFQLDEAEYEHLRKILLRYGAVEEHGRLLHSSSALVEALKALNGAKKAA